MTLLSVLCLSLSGSALVLLPGSLSLLFDALPCSGCPSLSGLASLGNYQASVRTAQSDLDIDSFGWAIILCCMVSLTTAARDDGLGGRCSVGCASCSLNSKYSGRLSPGPLFRYIPTRSRPCSCALGGSTNSGRLSLSKLELAFGFAQPFVRLRGSLFSLFPLSWP